jgi:hypothetical protein
MVGVCEKPDTGIAGFSFDDVSAIIRGSKEGLSAPKNESRSATICGPVAASEGYSPDIKDLF